MKQYSTMKKFFSFSSGNLCCFVFLALICFQSCRNPENTSTTKEEKETPATKTAEPVTKKSLSVGERMFMLCQACHTLKAGEEHKVGPNLHGIFGKKAGTTEGFKYSEALLNSEIIWDEKQIRNWLEKPNDFIPGTTMAFIGITDEAQQTALIEYLKKETQ